MTRHTFAIVVGILLLASAAHADKQKARVLAEKGTKQYNLGEYTAAAEAFKAAYDEFPEPTLLFNLAQCERQLLHKPRAITLYRSYLRELPNAPNAAEARRLVSSLEQEVAREEEERRQAEAKVREQREREQAAAPPAPATSPPVALPPPPRPWWKNPAGWTLIGLGVAAGAAGTALLVVANNDQNAAPKAATLGDAQAKIRDASAFRTAGYATVGVAGASTLAGVLVLALMPSRWKAHAAIAPLPGGAAVTVGGAL